MSALGTPNLDMLAERDARAKELSTIEAKIAAHRATLSQLEATRVEAQRKARLVVVEIDRQERARALLLKPAE